jgi:hypothetical protein
MKGMKLEGKVAELDFADHGIRSYQFSSDAVQQLGTKNLTVDQMKLFEPFLMKNATIVFYGCSVGLNGKYLSSISAALQGRTIWGPNYDFNWATQAVRDPFGKTRQDYTPLESPEKNTNFSHSP